MKKVLLLCLIVVMHCKPAEKTMGAAGTITLENTHWRLSEMNGMPVITPADAKEVHMVLTSANGEKRITGFAGCNGLGGNYTTDGAKIKFTVITTKMYCQDRMDIENFLTKTLDSANAYLIKGETLELYDGDTFLAKFDAVHLK